MSAGPCTANRYCVITHLLSLRAVPMTAFCPHHEPHTADTTTCHRNLAAPLIVPVARWLAPVAYCRDRDRHRRGSVAMKYMLMMHVGKDDGGGGLSWSPQDIKTMIEFQH